MNFIKTSKIATRTGAKEQPPLAPATCSASALDGYRAAEIIVEKALNESSDNCPRRFSNKMKRSAAYRQGYHDGLLVAHCQHALGAAPDCNQEAIRAALTPNTKLTP